MLKAVLLALAVAGCAHGKKDPGDKTDAFPATLYEQAADRLTAMLDNGWVVSRLSDGTITDQGDSLLFTGLAMGALDCQRGAVPEAALIKMLGDRHGGVYRHPSIPDDYSLDGLIGLWWGINHRTARCPETKSIWSAVLPAHAQAVDVEPVFRTVRAQVMSNLDIGSAPSVGERGAVGSVISGWALGVVSQGAAAFRLHLGFLSLDVVDAPKGKAAFCDIVPKANIALLEQFCGRPGLLDWAHGFAYNRYVYAFQRGAWESADGNGKTTPGLDLLMALALLYPNGALPPPSPVN